jgi:hypothetical protein
MRITALLALGLVGIAAACTDDAGTPFEPQLSSSSSSSGPAASASYRVTIRNLTSGQPLTPPLAVTHRRALHLFAQGRRASHEVQEIAENGNLAPMLGALADNRHVADVVVAEGPTVPPLLPGEEVSFVVSAERGARYLSTISMLICTNDGFTGVDGLRLPSRIGAVERQRTYGYDAGTEINTEDFADLVPPCPALTGVPSSDAGTGMSDPALAEHGRVRFHRGIRGHDDLDPSIHGWMGPVATIEVERIG